MQTNTIESKDNASGVFVDPNPPIETVSPEQLAAHDEFFAALRDGITKSRDAAVAAHAAMPRLVKAMTRRTNQSYHLRALLYSLYNGQPTSLLEIVNLDRALRDDFCAVLLAFGFSDPRSEETKRVSFFYDEMKAAIDAGKLWNWFIEADEEKAK